MKILTAKQMREVDRVTIEELGIPGLLMMENAGRNVFDLLVRKFPNLDRERVAIICGKGNNGGDGLVIARQFALRSPRSPLTTVLLTNPESLKGDAQKNYEMLLKTVVKPVVIQNSEQWAKLKPYLLQSTILVDAILGTGLTGPVEGFYRDVIRDLNESFRDVPIVAVDMPSGMPSDTGEAIGESVSARYTVTFTAPKRSQVFPPNSESVGELTVASVGTPPSVYENDASIYLNLLTPDVLTPLMAKRRADSHKGTYGHVLVIAGSRGKSGAAALCGTGALAAGAGLVTVATASSIWPVVASACPALMTEPLPETESATISITAFDEGRFEKILEGKTALCIGPGLSTDPFTVRFVRRLVAEFPEFPMVIDADGLNAFEGAADLLDGKGRKLILTPHPGEMARLTGLSTKEIQANRVDVARGFAMRQQVYLVLKGYRTLIAEPGGQVYVNPTGNPGMSTGGTGDVLTGITGGLIAQFPSLPVEQAVSAAVYWHGAAGDVAAARKGVLSLIATDVLEALPDALRSASIRRDVC